jgi:hypothetical protein
MSDRNTSSITNIIKNINTYKKFQIQKPKAEIPMLSIKDIIIGTKVTLIPWVILLIIIAGLIVI